MRANVNNLGAIIYETTKPAEKISEGVAYSRDEATEEDEEEKTKYPKQTRDLAPDSSYYDEENGLED